jgi:hypothetical protein
VFGLVLYASFNHALDRRLKPLHLAPDVRQQVDAARPSLAAAMNPDPRVEQAIDEAFTAGFRVILWLAAGLAGASALSAWLLLDPKKKMKQSARARVA